MGVGAFPELDDKDGVGLFVRDTHFVEPATQRGQQVTSCCQMRDKLVALVRKRAERANVRESHGLTLSTAQNAPALSAA